jgi:hypothetical protein
VVFECDEAGAVLGLILAGAGAGALISLNAPDLTSGQRALVNSGTAWGAANAVLLSIAADPDDEKTIAGVLLAGQLGGVLAGVGLTQLRPTSGQVALANSGGQWSLVLTGLTLAGLEADLDDAELAVALLVAADAGVAAGAYLAWRNPKISRAQTLLIDAGGIVGAVGGGSLGVIISGDEGDRTTPLLAAAGTVVGLGVTAYLTRNWTTDRDVPPVQAYVAPVTGARGGVAGVGFRW